MNIDVDTTTFLIAIIGMIVAIILGTVGPTITVMVLLHRSHRTDVSNLRDDVKGISERLTNVESALVGVQTELKAHSERFDRMDERFDRQEDHFNERFDRQEDQSNERFDRQDERHRSLEGKVDRVQGSLDVLIHGYRYTPVVTERERAERERQVGESLGD